MRKEPEPVRFPQILLLLFLFILALIPRLIWLNQVPTGISNDELNYVVNAKSFFLTGHGLTGNFSPIRITSTFPNAELVSVLIAPLIGPIPFSLFFVRLPFALLGAFTVLLLYLLTKKLIGAKEAFVVGLIACINPWNIYFSRTTYDAPVTAFFLLFGFYLLLSRKRWLILGAMLPLLIAFHTYMGMMILFPFFLCIVLYFAYTNIRKNPYWKEYIVVGIVCMLFVLRYMFVLPQMPGAVRLGKIFLPNSPAVSAVTDMERKLSIVTPMGNMFNNKITSYIKIQSEKYFNAFSP
jgi:4-amino-4-deoxy-L-arabinose transferase-like glycosyltransferase